MFGPLNDPLYICITELAIFHYWGLLQLSKGVVTTVKGGCYNCQKMKQKMKVSEVIPKQLKMSKYQSIKNISVLFLLWPNYRTGPLLRRFLGTVQKVQRPPAVVFVAALGGCRLRLVPRDIC